MRFVLAAFVMLLLATPAWTHSLDELQADLMRRERHVAFEPGIGTPFPSFRLIDPDGKTVSSSDLLGKVVILDFIDASCTDVCPPQSEPMAEVQKDVAAGGMADRVRFVSITVDPERDTAMVRKAYGASHGLDPSNWMFLAGSSGQETRDLAARAGLTIVPQADGSFDHPAVTSVIDDNGKLRARFFGPEFQPLNVVLYVNALINDPHHGTNEDAKPATGNGSLWSKLKSLL